MVQNCKSFPNNPEVKANVGKEIHTSAEMSHAHYGMDKLET